MSHWIIELFNTQCRHMVDVTIGRVHSQPSLKLSESKTKEDVKMLPIYNSLPTPHINQFFG